MRIETKQRKLYKFAELSESAQASAIEHIQETNGELYDHEFVYEDAANIGALMGIDLMHRTVKLYGGGTRLAPAIFYSGFWSQGDGACFEHATYSYAKGGLKAVMDYAPKDTELHRIARELQDVQRKHFYRLEATARHSGHYHHSGCMSIEVYDSSDQYRHLTSEDEEAVCQLLRDFADWIYDRLREDYEYQTSEDAAREAINANEYEFDEDGNLA